MAEGEWYHCFNRGVDKRRIFECNEDYRRFLALLYVCNGTKNIRLSDIYHPCLDGLLEDTSLERGEPLVEIGAYNLMPNHFHLASRQLKPCGVSQFMQKLSTGYTMYFNKKYMRAGALLAGTFKSKHVADDRYFKRVISYILLNHAELIEPGWKQGRGNTPRLKKKLLEYEYSSLPDFLQIPRLQGRIVHAISEYFDAELPLEQLVHEAHAYYAESPEVKP